ncbi:hypothetical protein ABZV77_38715 [Streptomyces sp. NPDC004732]|uniref:hypothetical protein n=1 Tax=Streptomyces sp. NPDC004732 TaxID=3154290 RepID=UPI0033A1EE49
METGDYIAAGSALVAASAACIASWQVVVARQASRAADLQARAALAQVELLREQFTHERVMRDQADSPVFAVRETDVQHGNGSPDIIAVIKQTGGSPVAEARVSVHLNGEPADIVDAADDGVLTWRHTAPGATRTLKIRTADRHRGELEIRVDLQCREGDDDGREWSCRVIGYAREGWRRNDWTAGYTHYGSEPRLLELAVARPGPDEYRISAVAHPEDRGLLSVTPVAVPPSVLSAAEFMDEEIW